MERLAYSRREWTAIARELESTYQGSAPPGLRERIAALLAGTPAAWSDQACELELDAASADVVREIVRRGRGQPADAGLAGQQAASLAEADAIVHDHQADERAAPTSVGYRLEHRTEGVTTVLGRTTHVHARQEELSRHAARLMQAGARGELVLVDEATGEDVARRALRPEEDTGAEGS